MFAIIYRWKVKPGAEVKFQAAWHQGTKDIRALFGTGGSRLHREANGDWLAYALWPSREARDNAFAQGIPSQAVAELQNYIASNVDQIELDIIDDLLAEA